MFYNFHQNNSGGIFIIDDRVGKYVIIEADNSNDANEKAKKIGIYFDGCRKGEDCSCCGDRWYEVYGNSKDMEPKIYGMTLKEYEDSLCLSLSDDEIVIHIYYKDGKHEIHRINAKQAIKRNKDKKQAEVDKIWGMAFNLYGLWGKKPVRLFKKDDLDTYYDKGGDLGISKTGFCSKQPECMEFGSKDKKDVSSFIDGAQQALNVALTAVEAFKNNNGRQDQTPYKNGVEAVIAHLKMILR